MGGDAQGAGVVVHDAVLGRLLWAVDTLGLHAVDEEREGRGDGGSGEDLRVGRGLWVRVSGCVLSGGLSDDWEEDGRGGMRQ